MAIDFQFAKIQAMKLNRAAGYVSKSRQRRDDSIAAQLKVIRRYARQRGLKIVSVATDGES
jgi:DNA invertase Pin-like site-specific DNA recombinase